MFPFYFLVELYKGDSIISSTVAVENDKSYLH